MSTRTHARLERLRHDQARPVWRGRRRHLHHLATHTTGACPACDGHGTVDGCWWCGQTPAAPEYVEAA